MSKVIAVGNLKGGVGKSTVAVNLACALARPERPVLLIDADAQGTASAWLTGHQPPAALLSVHVVPVPLMAGGDLEAWIGRVTALRQRYGLVVVDLPPQVDSGIAAAPRYADVFLVPVTPLGPDLKATAKALSLVQRARAAHGERPTCVLVPSRIDRRTALGRRAPAVLDRFGWRVGPTVHQRAAHVEAFGAGKWIGAYDPDGEAHAEIRALAEAIERLVERPERQLASSVCRTGTVPVASAQRPAGAIAAAEPQEQGEAGAVAAGVATGFVQPRPANAPLEPVSPAGSANRAAIRPAAPTSGVEPRSSVPAARRRLSPAPWLPFGAWLGALVQRLRGFRLRPYSRLARITGGRGL